MVWFQVIPTKQDFNCWLFLEVSIEGLVVLEPVIEVFWYMLKSKSTIVLVIFKDWTGLKIVVLHFLPRVLCLICLLKVRYWFQREIYSKLGACQSNLLTLLPLVLATFILKPRNQIFVRILIHISEHSWLWLWWRKICQILPIVDLSLEEVQEILNDVWHYLDIKKERSAIFCLNLVSKPW